MTNLLGYLALGVGGGALAAAVYHLTTAGLDWLVSRFK